MTDPETFKPVDLLVCVKCRRSREVTDDAERPGAVLHRTLSSEGLPDGIRLMPVECLSNCSQGCTIALRGPGRWTYVFGNLDETLHLEAIVDGASRYRSAPDGIVPWRERPEHFRKNCIARIPPMEAADV